MQISDAIANPGNVGGDIPDSFPSVANFVFSFGVASVVAVGTVTIPVPPGPVLLEIVDELPFRVVESILLGSVIRGTSGHSGQSAHSSISSEQT